MHIKIHCHFVISNVLFLLVIWFYSNVHRQVLNAYRLNLRMVITYVLHRGELYLVVLTASVLSVVWIHWRNFFSFLWIFICWQLLLLEKRHPVCTQQCYLNLVGMLTWWAPEYLLDSHFPVSTLDASSALGYHSDGCACSLVVFNDNLKNCSSFKHTDILMELEGHR